MNELLWLSPFIGSADPEPILRDVFDGWELGTGIFNYIATVAGDDLPWKDVETVDNSVLDISYFGNHSGGKFWVASFALLSSSWFWTMKA